jgi:hypothetical protein
LPPLEFVNADLSRGEASTVFNVIAISLARRALPNAQIGAYAAFAAGRMEPLIREPGKEVPASNREGKSP